MTVSPGVQREVKEQFEALFVDVFSGESGDVIVELRVPRETLAVGGKIPVSFNRRVPCETCKGSGRAAGAPACVKCEGKGRVSHDVTDGDAPGRGRAGESHVDAHAAVCERDGALRRHESERPALDAIPAAMAGLVQTESPTGDINGCDGMASIATACRLPVPR